MENQFTARRIILIKYPVTNFTRLTGNKWIHQPKLNLLHIRIVEIRI